MLKWKLRRWRLARWTEIKLQDKIIPSRESCRALLEKFETKKVPKECLKCRRMRNAPPTVSTASKSCYDSGLVIESNRSTECTEPHDSAIPVRNRPYTDHVGIFGKTQSPNKHRSQEKKSYKDHAATMGALRWTEKYAEVGPCIHTSSSFQPNTSGPTDTPVKVKVAKTLFNRSPSHSFARAGFEAQPQYDFYIHRFFTFFCT